MLRLADCYDRVGKSASAWALFREAASMARTRGEADRERIAAERAVDLEKRLSKIELRVDRKNVPSGLEIQINGMSVPRATWDAPIPVDPGSKRVSASAPDRTGWSTTVDVPQGPDVRTVEIPQLAPKPKSEVPEATAPGSHGTLRSVGYVAGSLGIASLAVGGLLSYKAYDANQQSLSQCRYEDPNACTPEGKDTRDRAKDLASGATIAFIAGGAALAGGVVLFIASRSSEPHRAGELRASAVPAPGGAALRLEGTW
jgi:hypothetical protein